MKPLGVALVVGGIVAFGGLMYMNIQNDAAQAQTCPGHWHIGYAIFVNGTRLSFDDRNAFYATGAHDHHIHNENGDDGVYHYHPGRIRCISLEASMDRLGLDVGGNKITVTQHPEANGEYPLDATRTLRVFHEPLGGTWTEVPWSQIRGSQLGNGDRVLVTYGTYTDEQIAAQQESVPYLGPNYVPSDA